MTELAIRLQHPDGSERRLRGVTYGGQLVLYTSDALALLIQGTRHHAAQHFIKLARRDPSLRHHHRPLGAHIDAQRCYKYGCENVITFDGMRHVALISKSPGAVRNRAPFLCALCALFAAYAGGASRELVVAL
jgi:hypothetical protein